MALQLPGNKRGRTQQPSRMVRRSRILQNFVLVWLDAGIDESLDDFQNSLEYLHRNVTSIDTFVNSKECLEFIATVQEEKIFMIISGTFGQKIVPQIHDNKQLYSIYIFCSNEKFHQGWFQEWSKVKGVYTQIQSICEELRKDRAQCDQDAIPMSFSGVDPSFMYTQLLKESLIDMEDDDQQQAVQNLVAYCRDRGNLPNDELKQFQQEYKAEKAIWWYTGEFFLYPMLNRALRALDVDTILVMGFFIRHLHQQLRVEQEKQDFGKRPFEVYRGQGLSEENFTKLRNTENGLISFNNFLSTSLNKDISLSFALRSILDSNNVGILFVMQVNPSECRSTPFASLDYMSYYEQVEEEVLFSTHTIFCLDKIKSIPHHETERLWQVELTLTDDQDNQLSELTERFRDEMSGTRGSSRLAKVLLQTGKSQKAAEIYEILYESAENQYDKAHYLHQLGVVYLDMREYLKALDFYENARAIKQKILPANHPSLATTYNNIGLVYNNMENYSKALEFYEKAQSMREKMLPTNHPDLATSYNNIGLVYNNMGNYSKALEFYEKARCMREITLPTNHPDLATSYNNIATVYYYVQEFSKALAFYEKSRSIYEKCLPVNHPDLATCYSNIAGVYSGMGQYAKALEFSGKDFEISKKGLPPNHPNLASAYKNMGNVCSKMGRHSKALEFYETARGIYEKSLPANHLEFAACYNNIGLVYKSMGEYSKALEFYDKARGIYEKRLPVNYIHLASSYNNIARVYSDMEEYRRALEFYEVARGISEKHLSANHPDLATSYSSIACVYQKMEDFGRALAYFEHAWEIMKKSHSENDADLKSLLKNIEFVRNRLHNN